MLELMKTLKSLGWSGALALLFLPGLVVSILMLPWIPLVARGADAVCRRGAQWLGVKVAPRESNRWFDLQQFYHLLVQLLLAAVAFAAWFFLCFVAGVLLAAPFLPMGKFSVGQWSTSDSAIVFAISWSLAAFAMGLLVLIARIVAIASAAVTRLALSPSAEELAASRSTLIDAFSGERRRIERELHDGPQQYLTALKLNLAAAKLHAKSAFETDASSGDASPAESLQTALQAAEHNASQALSALRATVRGIAPQVLFDNGLIAALEELVAHAGIDAQLHIEGMQQELDETTALLAYHCVAEGLTNATKHGGAEHADVELSFAQRIRVTITDDGEGAGPGTGRGTGTGTGTGIAGLRERAAALGGTVEFHRTSTLPLAESAGGSAQLILDLPILSMTNSSAPKKES